MRPRLIPPNARIPMLASASLPLAGAITNGQRLLLETAIDLYDQLGDVRHAATVFPGTTLDKAGAIESYRIFFAASPDMTAEIHDMVASGQWLRSEPRIGD